MKRSSVEGRSAVTSVMRPRSTRAPVTVVLEQREVGLGPAELVEDQVGDRRGPLRIAHGKLEADFLDQPALAGLQRQRKTRMKPGGSDHVHPDLARGVSAQHRAVLHEDDPGAQPRGGKGAAYPGHAAPGDEQVTFHAMVGDDVHGKEPEL